MCEDLVAYALGELDEADRQRVEQALASDDQLRAEFEQIQQCLAKGAADEVAPYGMPRGLADRTAREVSACCEESDAVVLPSSRDFAAGLSLMSPVDMTVAFSVLLTVGSMLLPALYSGRTTAQRIACQNNLHNLHTLNELYAREHRGFFPVVRPNEHAGIFATRLLEADFAARDEFEQYLLCAASPLADELAQQGRTFSVPTQADLSIANGMWLLELKRNSGGSYGYQVGYLKDGLYLPARRRNSRMIPLLADAPSRVDNHLRTANHGGKLTNVLWQDGSVTSEPTCTVSGRHDHLYTNANGDAAAGLSWDDAVLLSGGERPVADAQPELPEPILRLFFSRH